MLVPVEIDGCGPFDFILDTGRSTTLVVPELATEVNLETTVTKEGQTEEAKFASS